MSITPTIPTIITNPNSTLLSAKHLELYYAKKNILNDISFELKAKNIIGLVGRNGCGKSSLLKILDERIDYDGGRIEYKNDTTIGYLAQDLEYDLELTINEVFELSRAKIEKILEEYLVLPDGVEKYALENKISTHNWWNFDKSLETLAIEFGIPDRSKKLKFCSGGEQRRVSLVASLACNFDVLLLDEPTNHLDLDSIMKLGKFIRGYSGCVVVISHDRAFLDEVCTEIWEIFGGKLYKHSGGYSQFMENKAIRMEIASKTEVRKNQYLKRELEWVRAGVKARGTKDKGRMQRFEELSSQGKLVRESGVQMLLPKPTHIGARILDFKNVSLTQNGESLIDKFEFDFQKYHKIGIVGGNGVGKSTFLKLAMGILFDAHPQLHISNTLGEDGLLPVVPPNTDLFKTNFNETVPPNPLTGGESSNQTLGINNFTGDLSDNDFFELENNDIDHSQGYELKGTIKTGINTKFIYFDQNKFILDPERTPFEFLANYRDIIAFGDDKINSRKYLHRWLFSKDQYNTPIKFLSGGERSRLILAKILAEGGNFLILDEPTNDLDLDTIRILEEALVDYGGMVIVVSHDRYFLNRVCNYVFGFEGKGNITVSTGNYDDYLDKKIDLEQVKAYHQKLKKEAKLQKSISKDAGIQIVRVEKEIAMVESKIKEYTTAFEDVELYTRDPARFNNLHKLLNEKERELESLMKKWTGLQGMV